MQRTVSVYIVLVIIVMLEDFIVLLSIFYSPLAFGMKWKVKAATLYYFFNGPF